MLLGTTSPLPLPATHGSILGVASAKTPLGVLPRRRGSGLAQAPRKRTKS